ncbi:Mucin-associated surface protein (MASP), subgroup S070 [Trypanosoma cruzi]|nr:Mucin-associated surface protein (MASP), subgroup S070 [Trypanosoma cruzi]
MMMTGRVLLVCALCVLWCGVCGGGCSETTPASPAFLDNTSDGKPQNDSTGVAGGGVQNGQQAAPQAPAAASTTSGLPAAPASPSPAPQSGGEASETASATTDNKVQNGEGKKKEEKKEEVEDKEEKEEHEEDEEEEEKEEEEDEEEEEDDTKEEEETKKEEAVTSTREGISAGGQEQPSLSSGAEGASNITNPNSTPTTGDDDPAADGAGTAEGKQSENKEANLKETPVTATAMKNTTATTGDSDGSTAISHTTSPLLLLLVAACAASTAVVAA